MKIAEKTRTAEIVNSLPENGVTKTENAVIVNGRDYFYSFDIIEEEA